MIRSVLTLKPRPGCAQAIVELFEREMILERALQVEGCHGASMLTSESEILVTASWTDADAYQSWLAHPERDNAGEELSDLLETPLHAGTSAGLYRVALDARPQEGLSR